MNAHAKPAKQSGTVTIHGREYQTVAYRVQQFREARPNFALTTDVLFRDADCVVVRASIADDTQRILATGHAEEYRKSSQINKTSALENAETSAIGRALAALGFGGTEFATANEVQNAVHQQQHNPQTGEVTESPPREKVNGISKIKERLNKFMIEGNACTDLEEFRAMVKANKDDIKTVREANHEYWVGDGQDWEGFGAWMERRYAELAPKEHSLEFQMLVSCVRECASGNELRGFLTKHGDAVALLDGEESREFERIYDERAEALKLVDQASV